MGWAVALIVFSVILIIFLVSGFWPTFFGAPWVPTKRIMVHQMLDLADVGPSDVVYDLGCGDGRVLVAAARNYGARAVGIEIEPLKFLWCHLIIAVLGLRKQVNVKFGNFFAYDLSEATVVTSYLSKEINGELAKKLHAELKPNTRVISNTFTFPGMEPIKEEGVVLLYLFNQQ
ncbi:MAG: SAM-dependent methyltransferase [Anaerolineae bacterium]|jgi:cyclopropane fatty-acyl-phospholipid synthase-like methyltransferase|nr:SAM-dependent methyltransferase [Anaerolineae bacterium]